MHFEGPAPKSLVKIWIPGHISIFAFYERYYEQNVGSADGELRIPLLPPPKGSQASIWQKRKVITDLIYDIEDEGYCVLSPGESVFRAYTGYYPIRKQKPTSAKKIDAPEPITLKQMRESFRLSIEEMAKMIGYDAENLKFIEEIEPFYDKWCNLPKKEY